MELIKTLVSIIVVCIIEYIFQFFRKTKKKEGYVLVPIFIPHRKEDLACKMAFTFLAILAWAFALWIFLKAGFSWTQFVICILITTIGIVFMTHHIRNKIWVSTEKLDLIEAIMGALARSNRSNALFSMPIMAAYLIYKNAAILKIAWAEWLFLGICVLALITSVTIQIVYSKKTHIDISAIALNPNNQ